MHWTFRRGGGRPPTRSLMGSLLVHAGVVVLAIVATRRSPEPLTFITYEIEIVSPPPQRAERLEDPAPRPPEEELVIERPEEAPEEVPEQAVPLPEAEPEPAEEPPEDPEPEEEPEETPPEDTEETPVATEEPVEESDESGEDIEVRMEGLRRDFPEYYEGIIRQIRRCFRPQGFPAGLRTTVYFVIRGDGTVTDARFVEQSGNPGFDYEALGAITDCAGQGRFGPLPPALPYERLPIQFEFRPPGGDDASPTAATPAAPAAAPEGDR